MMRPNILYIHSHDTGRYVQPYGYRVSTPNIQRLADEGILFRQAFCAAPTCSPSRASLLTGRSAHSSGMIGLAHRGFSLSDYHQHLVHTLRTAGYSSTLIGVQHEARDPQIIGYDRIVQLPDNHAAHVAPAAVDLLNHAPSEPFFASVGFFETHREFPEPEPAEDARYVCPPPSLPDAPETRRDVAAFMTGARQLDRGVGLVLRALQRSGLAQNTLVICTTDHGMAFPGIKCNLKDAGIGVMLIMRGPGGFSGGRVCDAMVSQIDIFPTLCDLLGIDPPPWLEGHSLLPWISGQRQEIRDELFAEVTYHAAYEPQRALRTRRWKYIRRYGGKQTPVLPNCDDSPSKELWLQLGWREQVLPQEQFYDLAFDPNETHNLAYDPSQQTTLEDMRYRLDRWMRETSDPLLCGPVLAPSGAQVNDPEGLSPREPTLVVP